MTSTPGPLTADGNAVRDARGYCLATTFDTSREGEKHANAALFAAGPDLLAVALAYERWEADLILCAEAWAPQGAAQYPTLTPELWDRLLEIQALRDAAVSRAKGGA